MRKLSVIALVVFVSLGFVKAQEIIDTKEVIKLKEAEILINWESSFKEAQNKAEKQNKPILIYFTGSDWCGPCIKLDRELFHTKRFKEFADKNLILYMADFPRNSDLVRNEVRVVNKELSEKYNQNSFPSMIMVDASEAILGQKDGVYMTEYYFPFFESIIRDYY